MRERGASSAQHGLALALGSAAAFGTNIVSAQLAGHAGLSGPLIVFYRVFLMLALVVGAALIWRASLVVPRRHWSALALFGLSTALTACAYLSSVAFLPITVAAVAVSISMAATRISASRWAGGRAAIAVSRSCNASRPAWTGAVASALGSAASPRCSTRRRRC